MAGSSIGSITGNCTRFIIGTWAEPLGKQCYHATRGKKGRNIFNFNWKNAYDTYWRHAKVVEKAQPKVESAVQKALEKLPEKTSVKIKIAEATKAAKKAVAKTKANNGAKQAIKDMIEKTVKKNADPGFFTKIGKVLGKIPGAKFLGKYFFPITLGIQTVAGFVSGFKEGGLGEGLKEAGRGILKMIGWSVATALIAATLPVSGFIAMAASFALSTLVFDNLIDKVLGKSAAEQKAEQLAAAQEYNSNSYASDENPFKIAVARNSGRSLGSFGSLTNGQQKPPQLDMRAIDNLMSSTEAMFNKRNNCYTPV